MQIPRIYSTIFSRKQGVDQQEVKSQTDKGVNPAYVQSYWATQVSKRLGKCQNKFKPYYTTLLKKTNNKQTWAHTAMND